MEHSPTGSRNTDRSGGDVENDRPATDVTLTVEVTPDGFRIDDDGPGIPPEEREALLDAEFGSSESGFGVPIIRAIAEGHGWELSFDESDSGGLRIEIVTAADGTD